MGDSRWEARPSAPIADLPGLDDSVLAELRCRGGTRELGSLRNHNLRQGKPDAERGDEPRGSPRSFSPRSLCRCEVTLMSPLGPERGASVCGGRFRGKFWPVWNAIEIEAELIGNFAGLPYGIETAMGFIG